MPHQLLQWPQAVPLQKGGSANDLGGWLFGEGTDAGRRVHCREGLTGCKQWKFANSTSSSPSFSKCCQGPVHHQVWQAAP
ncbi:hypothetical protein BC830DRAFT_1157596 [Chytriomyces sp. MP71]|nr:hypothetical protein BC830DRAFT_1157596 [Chytriomyces sp. MP71]